MLIYGFKLFCVYWLTMIHKVHVKRHHKAVFEARTSLLDDYRIEVT